jgi:hypothetical protein
VQWAWSGLVRFSNSRPVVLHTVGSLTRNGQVRGGLVQWVHNNLVLQVWGGLVQQVLGGLVQWVHDNLVQQV